VVPNRPGSRRRSIGENGPGRSDAEYVARTQLQADAFITLDPELARAVQDLVTVAPIDALS